KDWRDVDKSLTALVRKQGKYLLHCGPRTTPFSPVAPDEAKAQLQAARFTALDRPRPHALARDSHYYVDRAREHSYRVFVGPKGALKRQKMIDVVDDSQGQIFVTASGKLRLLISAEGAVWSAPNESRQLSRVPIDENLPMIFGDLGV